MLISRTPLRISFFGGGTDYPDWYNKHGGTILGTSIDKYCYVMLHDGDSWKTFDLPTKSGLGSSSAYTVGLLRATTDLDKRVIAKLATVWERDKLTGNIGSQDQYLCALGGFHLLRFDEHGIRDKLLSPDSVRPLQEYLMLFDTHQYRLSGSVVASQLENIKDNEAILSTIQQIAEDSFQCIQKSDWLKFGELLDESWSLKKQLSKEISTKRIDSIYDSAIKAGAIGGKLLGAGGGGFMVFFVEKDKQDMVKEALSELTYIPFKFEEEGTKVIYHD